MSFEYRNTGYEFSFTSTVSLQLSANEISILKTNSLKHYDSQVKALSRIGGILYHVIEAEDYSLVINSRHLQLLGKSLEQDHTPEGRNLYERLYKILAELLEATTVLNKQFER